MKDVQNCPRCGAIFIKALRPICPQCHKKQEQDYDHVSKFMRKKQNRTATIQEVHVQTGVELQQIHQFVRDGRLLTKQFPNLTYPCASCGVQINEGKICTSCMGNITEGLEKAEKEKNFTERIKEAEKEKTKTITYHSLNDRLNR